MRAEIAGKLSMTSPTSQDRLEDTLTDGVFSALAYLPREVLGAWLTDVLPSGVADALDPGVLEAAQFDFWPTLPGRVEPDVVLRLGTILVVIEAKYRSAFHSIGRRHQLAAEWFAAREIVRSEGLRHLVVVAVTDHTVPPADVETASAQVALEPAVTDEARTYAPVVWCSWQDIAKRIEGANAHSWSSGAWAVARDVLQLMQRRKVRYMFEGINRADWWVLAAAADAASKRVYPAVAEFARELTQAGKPRGLVWGGTDSGVVWYESKQVGAAAKWHRNYVHLPMLAESFGKRLQNYCSLYALFTFNEPSVRAGWWFQLPRNDFEDTDAEDVAAWLNGLDSHLDVLASTNWDDPGVPVDRDQMDGTWFTALMKPRGGWLRIERRWEPEEVSSTAPVVDLLATLSHTLEQGPVLDLLARNRVLDRVQAPSSPTLDLSVDDD